MDSVTVIRITSLSYTGTTWLNLLLACHDDAFALGPPDRVLRLLREGGDAADACRVHAGDCGFWPGFFAEYDRSRPFFTQLAARAGCRCIVINNPEGEGPAAKELRHPSVVQRPIHVVRDGRGTMASYLKYHPDDDFVTAVQSWFLPSASALHFDPQDEDVLCVRYEDVARDPRAFLDRAGAFVDMDYPADAIRFYARTHHATAGNRGTLSFLRRHEGRPFEGTDAERREADYQHLLAHPDETRLDERWKDVLGERERLAFDWFAGAVNARWGYPRDRFTVSAVHDFESATRVRPVPIAPPAPPEAPTDRAMRLRRLLTNHRPLLIVVAVAWIVTVVIAFALGALAL